MLEKWIQMVLSNGRTIIFPVGGGGGGFAPHQLDPVEPFPLQRHELQVFFILAPYFQR